MVESQSLRWVKRDQRVVVYAWSSPTVGTSLAAQGERLRRHCEDQGWGIVGELASRRFPDLVELSQRAMDAAAPRVILTREARTDLERRYPELWDEITRRLAARGVTIVVC